MLEGQAVEVDSQETASVSFAPAGATLPSDPVVDTPMSLAFGYPVALYSPLGAGFWDIHQGFNASVSAGVTCGFGRNNPYRGAAFFTSLEGLYAFPVNDKLTLAAGLGYTRYTGWGQGQSSLDLFGLANYRFNEKFDASVFFSHGFGPLGGGDRLGMRAPYVPGISSACTTVGAEFGIKVGDAVRVGVGVSVTKEEGPRY